MIQELRRHGYEVSPGTLYPILHRMEHLGWLRSETDIGGGLRARRMYCLTEAGKGVLEVVQQQITELMREVRPGRQD
jgi:DNA-binding PadR family transcriptional regulator